MYPTVGELYEGVEKGGWCAIATLTCKAATTSILLEYELLQIEVAAQREITNI